MSTEAQQIVYPDTVTVTDKYVEIRADPKRYNIPQEILDDVNTETIWTLFERYVKKRPEHDFLGVREYNKEKNAFADHYTYKSLAECHKTIEKAAYGFNALGLKLGDIVTECCKNRPEWLLAELGVIRQAGATSPLRSELDNTYYEPIVLENKPKFAVIDPEKVDDFLTLCEHIKEHGHELTYKAIIVFPHVQGPKFGDEGYLSDAQVARGEAIGVKIMKWEDFLEIGEPCPVAEQKPSNLHSIVYTSGTTSQYPKGTLLTQQSFVCERCRQEHFIYDDTIYYSYIPMAHISERGTISLAIGFGCTIGFASGSIDTFLDDFEILKPTQFAGVPLLLKAIYLKAMAAIRATGNKDMVNAIFRKKFGGDGCRSCITYGAPVSMDIVEWMVKDLGIKFTNNYGSTEVAGCPIMTPLSNELPAVGCIGFPKMLTTCRLVDIPEFGYSVKDDPPRGELILKFPGMPLGYLNKPEKTKELIDEDGWLHTNDVAQLNPDGSISLIDRKDNMLRTVNATYVPTEKIESLLGLSPLISRIWVYCEPCDNFLVCTVVPDFNVLALHLTGELKEQCVEVIKNPSSEAAAAFCANPAINKLFLGEIHAHAEKNHFPFYWDFKGVLVDSAMWCEANGLMTYTSKLKRKALLAKYKPQLDTLLTGLRKSFNMVYE